MEGDPVVDRLMKPVRATIEHYVKNQAAVIAIYNRAYEAAMNSMTVIGVMREQLGKANAHAKAAEAELAALREAHPRAFKLMVKNKPFIVIANDEPYFRRAYNLIRNHEVQKGTWTDEDQWLYEVMVENLEGGE